MNDQSRLAKLFENLDRWRHLPNYQLERRADAFFALYLQGLVEEKVGRSLSPTIVPELPILCSLVWKEREGMKSVKADYLLLAEDRSEAYLVELKTDAGSRWDQQDDYLRLACDCGLRKVIEGVIAIAKASASRRKYANLLQLLASAGLVRVPASGAVSNAWFASAEVLDCPPVLRRIYIQPSGGAEGEEVISFADVKKHVAQFDDEFSTLFARHLEQWAQKPGYAEQADRSEDRINDE